MIYSDTTKNNLIGETKTPLLSCTPFQKWKMEI